MTSCKYYNAVECNIERNLKRSNFHTTTLPGPTTITCLLWELLFALLHHKALEQTERETIVYRNTYFDKL